MANGTSSLTAQQDKLSYRELAIFFMPLALSSMLMMSSHSIVSSAMARTAQAEIALAAFAVASSISMMFESPCYNIKRMAVSLFDDQLSLQNIFKVGLGVLFISVGLMIPIAYTGFGKVVFINWVGINPDLYPEVIRSFRVFMLLPVVSATRGFFQGILIVKRRTYWLTINVVIRLAVMVILTGVVLNIDFIDGSLVGSIILVTGIGTEALLALVTGLRYKKSFPNQPTRFDKSITVKDALIFFFPLIAASLAQTFSRPGINAGLARVANPEQALASYQVAYSFAMIFIVLLYETHQLILVFAKDKFSFMKLIRFVAVLGITMTCLLLLFGLTPIGEWTLINIIGVSDSLADVSVRVIAWFALLPLIVCCIEVFNGLLMLNRRTPTITVAKTGNVIMVVVIATTFSFLLPQLGGSIGAISMACGALIEFIIVFFRGRDILFS